MTNSWLHLLVTCTLSTLPPSPPPFSWDTIPLFIHAGNETGSLNKTAAKYMATYPLATIEKMQDEDANLVCNPGNGKICEEDRIIQALKQIRSYSDDTRTIFYLNSLLNFPQYNLSTQFFGENEKYLLHDQNGKIVLWTQCAAKSPNTTVFDLSYNETINFWLDTVKYAMSKYPGVVDGVFADRGNTDITQSAHCINITKEKQQAWNQGILFLISSMFYQQRKWDKITVNQINRTHLPLGTNTKIDNIYQ